MNSLEKQHINEAYIYVITGGKNDGSKKHLQHYKKKLQLSTAPEQLEYLIQKFTQTVIAKKLSKTFLLATRFNAQLRKATMK